MRAFITTILSIMTLTSSSIAADEYPSPIPLGTPAPAFELPGVDGRNWSLDDFSDSEILIVLFTCNHCPTAQYYEARVNQLFQDYKDKGVSLVAISPNDPESVRLDELGWSDLSDTFEEMKTRAEMLDLQFPYLYDGDNEKVSKSYGPLVTPHVFVFNKDRVLTYEGAIDDSERPAEVEEQYLRNALDSMLAGETPAVQKTKVVGCSVKWAGKEHLVKNYMDKLAAAPVSLELADADVIASLRANKGTGKFRLINFWATWCAPCIAEFEEFVTIDRMYRHREFEFISVSMNRPDEQAQVLEFLTKKEASNKNYIFAQNKRPPLIDAFNPEWQGVAPYTVLINPEGEIIYTEVGTIDPLPLKRKIVSELNARKPW